MVGSQQEFWKWFREHEGELFDFDDDPERTFDRLANKLREVDPDLTFEFGPKRNAKREFVISAGGIKRAFPAVSALVAAAPSLERWQITAFRPRRPSLNVLEFRDKRVEPNDVQFTLLDDGQKAGIYLFIPGYKDNDTNLKQIGYLLLDDALGEYDVETKLALIKMFSPEVSTAGERHPLSELPRLFDQLVFQLAGQSRN
jgi:hypothetical protein